MVHAVWFHLCGILEQEKWISGEKSQQHSPLRRGAGLMGGWGPRDFPGVNEILYILIQMRVTQV